MAQLENVRRSNDVRLNVSLNDNGVRVSWDSLESIHAALYADNQRMMAGSCEIIHDTADNTNLIVKYGAEKPQYLGPQRLVMRCVYKGQKKTYDVLAFNFVATTDELSGQPVIIEDPEVDVELAVQDVSTSLLDEAIDACIAATAKAIEAASSAEKASANPPTIGENGNWQVWNSEAGMYQDSGVAAQGPQGLPGTDGKDGEKGDKGESGNINYPTFDINGAMELVMTTDAASDADRFELDEHGNLILNI